GVERKRLEKAVVQLRIHGMARVLEMEWVHEMVWVLEMVTALELALEKLFEMAAVAATAVVQH
ncbi:hypothetical protein BGX27_003146, partial [Mortierella sp. AM989]